MIIIIIMWIEVKDEYLGVPAWFIEGDDDRERWRLCVLSVVSKGNETFSKLVGTDRQTQCNI